MYKKTLPPVFRGAILLAPGRRAATAPSDPRINLVGSRTAARRPSELVKELREFKATGGLERIRAQHATVREAVFQFRMTMHHPVLRKIAYENWLRVLGTTWGAEGG